MRPGLSRPGLSRPGLSAPDAVACLLAPRSIAIIGASARPGSLGHSTVRNVLEHSRYEGDVHLVNPRGGEIDGRTLHPSLGDVPAATIDLALVLVPADDILRTLEDCVAKHVRVAIVFTGGFAELGDAGRQLEQQMLRIAAEGGMRLYGPNCAGVTTLAPRLGLTFSTEFRNDRGGGPLALVTQGGGLGRSLMQGSDRGLHFSTWFSTGNELDLGSPDFIAALALRDDIKVICVVMEGIKSGEDFIRALRIARDRGKTVIILKVGRSRLGAEAAKSHTASLAGEDAVNDAVFRQYGALRVDDLDEMLDAAALALRTGERPLERLCVYSSSGGAGVLATDHIGCAGLDMARLAPETVAAMARHAPPYAALGNPVDLTTKALSDPELTMRCLSPLFADEGVDAVLYLITSNYAATTEQAVRSVISVAESARAPLLPVWMSSRRGPAHDRLLEAGFTPFYSLKNVVTALQRLKARQAIAGGEADAAPAARVQGEPLGPRRDERSVKQWLGLRGLRSPRELFADTAVSAGEAAQAVGFPVVMKLVADGVLHKSDVGGVALNLQTPEEAQREYGAMLLRARQHGIAEARLRGVLICETVAGGLEALVGVHRDEVFGPILTVGLGGVHVEVFNEVARCRLPAGRAHFERLLDETRLGDLLKPLRGRPPLDRKALVDAMEIIAAAALDLGADCQSIEINPLVVLPEGRGVVALDAVIE